MSQAANPAPPPGTLARTLVRGVGWLFIGTGATLLLFLVWLLWFTGISTNNVQDELRQEFLDGFGFAEVDIEDVDLLPEGSVEDGLALEDGDGILEVGAGVALLEFERPGEPTSPVNEDPLVVVMGTSEDALRRGPGLYSTGSRPGESGNVSIVGHRTTYGAPFYNLDLLRAGDLVHLTDRSGRRFTYRVLEGDGQVSDGTTVVGSGDTWVLGDRPLGRQASMLTLITCHPRFSSSNRLIGFAELVGSEDAP